MNTEESANAEKVPKSLADKLNQYANLMSQLSTTVIADVRDALKDQRISPGEFLNILKVCAAVDKPRRLLIAALRSALDLGEEIAPGACCLKPEDVKCLAEVGAVEDCRTGSCPYRETYNESLFADAYAAEDPISVVATFFSQKNGDSGPLAVQQEEG